MVFQKLKNCGWSRRRSADRLSVVVTSVVFGLCDLIDQLLCPVFRFLDWHIDHNSTPCHCHQVLCAGGGGGEAGAEFTEFWTGPSHTLYSRRQKELRPKSAREGYSSSSSTDDLCDGAYEGDENASPASNSLSRNRKRILSSWTSVSTSGSRLDLNGDSTYRETRRKAPARKAWWSDCGCETCTAWRCNNNLLHVHIDGKDVSVTEGFEGTTAPSVEHNVLFIHGFLSSSNFWVETVLPHLSDEVKSSYRLFAVDVLGFGKSPRPDDCLYTNADHVDMIRRSVLEKYDVKKLHVVAHSMGCTIALALAGQDPMAVKSVTLLAPLYFPTRPGVPPASYVLSNVAPQKVWPFFAFVHSVMSWYEHLGRILCLVVCRHHRFWVPILEFASRLQGSRIPRSFIHDYMQHSHNSAFKMFHNTICSGPFVMEHSMKLLQQAGQRVRVIHGEDDATCSVKCGHDLSQQFSNVSLCTIPGAGHMSVVLGREQDLARELEEEILGTYSNH